jgi:hypothetical protein
MVQAIENWAELTGTVEEVKPREGVPQMSDLVLAVDGASDVEGYPNLLTESPGQVLAVSVRNEKLGQVAAGDKVRAKVQRADPRTVLVHPDGLSVL